MKDRDRIQAINELALIDGLGSDSRPYVIATGLNMPLSTMTKVIQRLRRAGVIEKVKPGRYRIVEI